jgi:hypothetical protein
MPVGTQSGLDVPESLQFCALVRSHPRQFGLEPYGIALIPSSAHTTKIFGDRRVAKVLLLTNAIGIVTSWQWLHRAVGTALPVRP